MLKLPIWMLTALILWLAAPPSEAAKASKSERVKFQKSIIDRQRNLDPRFKKQRRKQTRYIIVHTSEGGLKGTLNVVSQGKVIRGRRISYGGHTHYVIARNGQTYRILNKKYRADHAGLSMWNGRTDISDVSIGIELVGYHYMPVTSHQYRSLRALIAILQNYYRLNDRAVLTHSQVAYGRPNQWFRHKHRGRKRCAKNLDRSKAGIGQTWSYDPDVKAGRLTADKDLAKIFYQRRVMASNRIGSNVITASNSAWSIAGGDYDSHRTLYKLPDGRLMPGDRIVSQVGWNKLPVNTVVLLNQEEKSSIRQSQHAIKTITNGLTAWHIAGSAYGNPSTYYFFPNGKIKNGSQISDWDDLPEHTQMIVGYRKPQPITPSKPAMKIAGKRYNHGSTLYYFPAKGLVAGNSIDNFSRLPKGVLVFVAHKQNHS